jgi:Uracil phosphoribosyltransferase
MAAPSCHTGAAHLSRPAPPKYENVIVLPQTNQLIALLTICRDKTTTRADFIFYANRIIRLLVEEGIAGLYWVGINCRVESPSGCGEESDNSNRYLRFLGGWGLGLANVRTGV